jgi:hypothetical protein
MYHWPCVSVFILGNSIWNTVYYLQHSSYLILIQFSFVIYMIFIKYPFELGFFQRLWVKIVVKTISTYLEQYILNLCHIICLWIWSLTNIAHNVLRFLYQQPFIMLFRREIDQSPVLQKGMYSHNRADISKQVFPTQWWGEVFFSIFPPHKNHGISIVLVKIGIFHREWENIAIDLSPEILREVLFLNFMDLVLFKPGGNRRKRNVRRRLNYGPGCQTTIVSYALNVLSGHLHHIR